MALDPNIALQVQPPQVASPLDLAAKALTLKQLSQQSQITDRQMADDQAMRQAFSQNMTTDPRGQPTLNRQAALSDLYKVNPQKAIDYQKMFQGQDLEKLSNDTKAAKELAWSIYDEPSYQQARAKAQQMGLPNSDKLPPTFIPSFVQNWQVHTLEGDKQIDAQLKQQDMQRKDQEFKIRNQELQENRAQRFDNKQNNAMLNTSALLESARGNPAVSQAEKDLLAAKKVDSMVNLYGDPNKLSPQQVQLLASEVAKIASGGVPTEHELKGLNPSTIPSSLASLAQKVTNNPQSAEAGAFVKQMQDYTNSLKTDAQGVIQEKYGRVIESRKGQLGQDNYNSLKDQYLNRFKNSNQSASSGGKMNFDHLSDADLQKMYNAAGGK